MKIQMFTYVDGIDEAVAFYQEVFDTSFGEIYKRKDGGY